MENDQSLIFQTDIGERYKIESIKGKGSFGEVYACLDRKTNEKVAIKRIFGVNNEDDARKLIRELRIMHNFKHNNILRLRHVIFKRYRNFFHIYLVSDLWDSDLSKVLKLKMGEQFKEDHIVYIIYQLFYALHFLHSNNIAHRDIKPNNILINEDCSICYSDFGLSRQIQDDEETELTYRIACKIYRAPEIMLKNDKYNCQVDIWSLGISLYEFLIKVPFLKNNKDEQNYRELLEKIQKINIRSKVRSWSRDSQYKILAAVCQKQFQKDISDCYPKARDLLDKCIKINPKERIQAGKALKHDFIIKCFEEDDLKVKKISTDFSFEYNREIPFIRLKIMILEEINKINKEAQEELVDIEKFKYQSGVK